MYIVISGGGKVGEYLAKIMLRQGNEVAIIENDERTANRLASILSGRYLVIKGDGCISRYQEEAGIRLADVFVATTGQDYTNLMACEIASRIFEVNRCIARVNSPKNTRIFREVDIECICSTSLIGSIIEEEAMAGSVNVLGSLAHGNVSLKEIIMPRMHNHDNEEGIHVADVDLPPGCLFVAVSHSDEDGMEVVNSETMIRPGDLIIMAVEIDMIDLVLPALKRL